MSLPQAIINSTDLIKKNRWVCSLWVILKKKRTPKPIRHSEISHEHIFHILTPNSHNAQFNHDLYIVNPHSTHLQWASLDDLITCVSTPHSTRQMHSKERLLISELCVPRFVHNNNNNCVLSVYIFFKLHSIVFQLQTNDFKIKITIFKLK